jgi:hypothetical protein
VLHRIATVLAVATVAGFLAVGTAAADGDDAFHVGDSQMGQVNVGGSDGVSYNGENQTGASYHHNRWFDLDD